MVRGKTRQSSIPQAIHDGNAETEKMTTLSYHMDDNGRTPFVGNIYTGQYDINTNSADSDTDSVPLPYNTWECDTPVMGSGEYVDFVMEREEQLLHGNRNSPEVPVPQDKI